jgi:hypothetical protein
MLSYFDGNIQLILYLACLFAGTKTTVLDWLMIFRQRTVNQNTLRGWQGQKKGPPSFGGPWN